MVSLFILKAWEIYIDLIIIIFSPTFLEERKTKCKNKKQLLILFTSNDLSDKN